MRGWLEAPPSREVFLAIRAELIRSEPSAELLAHVAARLERWPSGVERFAPIEWLWRASRGAPCPELELCNALDPSYLRRAFTLIEREQGGRDHHLDEGFEALLRDGTYVARQVAYARQERADTGRSSGDV